MHLLGKINKIFIFKIIMPFSLNNLNVEQAHFDNSSKWNL